MDDRDLLPVRYGTQVSDEASVRAVLDQNYERLFESLERVRGAAEVSVRAYAADHRSAQGEDEKPRTGTEYMRARAQELAAREEAVQAIQEPLTALARTVTSRPTSLPGEVLCAAYLLDRERVARFGERVAKLQAENLALRLTCTGPWPPYSFAER